MAAFAVRHRQTNREVDAKHIDADYGFGLLTIVEKIAESPELLAISSATAVARHFSGRHPRGLRETPPFSLSPRPIDSTTRHVVP